KNWLQIQHTIETRIKSSIDLLTTFMPPAGSDVLLKNRLLLLDDLSAREGACGTLNCKFKHDMCGYQIEHLLNQLSWIRVPFAMLSERYNSGDKPHLPDISEK